MCCTCEGVEGMQLVGARRWWSDLLRGVLLVMT